MILIVHVSIPIAACISWNPIPNLALCNFSRLFAQPRSAPRPQTNQHRDSVRDFTISRSARGTRTGQHPLFGDRTTLYRRKGKRRRFCYWKRTISAAAIRFTHVGNAWKVGTRARAQRQRSRPHISCLCYSLGAFDARPHAWQGHRRGLGGEFTLEYHAGSFIRKRSQDMVFRFPPAFVRRECK